MTLVPASSSRSSGGGSSAAIKLLGPFPVAYNSPGAVPFGTSGGFTVYTLAAGEFLLATVISVTTPWDGMTPNGYTMATGNNGGALFNPKDLTVADGALFNNLWSLAANQPVGPNYYASGGPQGIAFIYDDSGGGDPGSTQGAGSVYLVVGTPALT